jgi:hypothetical protein
MNSVVENMRLFFEWGLQEIVAVMVFACEERVVESTEVR